MSPVEFRERNRPFDQKGALSSFDLNRAFHVQNFVSTRMGAVRDATGENRPDSDHASYRVLRQLYFRVRSVPDPAAAFFPPITPFLHCT